VFYIFFNGVMIGTVSDGNFVTGSLGSSLANLPASTIMLAPTALNAFHTGTSLLSIDYILAAVGRT
jgi:hypothetical protein